MEQYILAHDLGTTGNKATLYSLDGTLVKSCFSPYELLVSESGEAEQNADDWWYAVITSTKALIEGIDPATIACLSFSGQMMGCLCVDREGRPLRPSLIWADIRSGKEAAALAEQIPADDFYQIIGHRLSPSYSATKFMWIKAHEPEVYKKTYRMLNAKDYIIYRLTGVFATEPSDASSTCLMNIRSLSWSESVLGAAGLDRDKLPDILPSTAVVGGVTKEAAKLSGLLVGTPVVMGGGDGSCAAVGCGVVKEGSANLCLGTSSWISVASSEPLFDGDKKTFTFAHTVPGMYIPTGTMQTGGGALSWAVKTLFGSGSDFSPSDKEAIYEAVNREAAASPLGAKGLVFLPYLMGERSPRWNDKAKGSFVGLTMAHERGDLLRAVMEGVAYNLSIILKSLQESGAGITELLAVGGGARNPAFLEIIGDCLGVTMKMPYDIAEATSMGAAITGGVGIGAFTFEDAERFIKIKSERPPIAENTARYENLFSGFDALYERLCPYFDTL